MIWMMTYTAPFFGYNSTSASYYFRLVLFPVIHDPDDITHIQYINYVHLILEYIRIYYY